MKSKVFREFDAEEVYFNSATILFSLPMGTIMMNDMVLTHIIIRFTDLASSGF